MNLLENIGKEISSTKNEDIRSFKRDPYTLKVTSKEIALTSMGRGNFFTQGNLDTQKLYNTLMSGGTVRQTVFWSFDSFSLEDPWEGSAPLVITPEGRISLSDSNAEIDLKFQSELGPEEFVRQFNRAGSRGNSSSGVMSLDV